MKLKLEISNRVIQLDVGFIFLCLAVASLPINKEIAGPFRLSDVFLIFSIGSIITEVKISQGIFQILVGLAAILAISSVLGVFAYGIQNIQNLGFVYKYMVPILPIVILSTLKISDKGIVLIHRIMFYVFLFLALWVYIYLTLKILGLIAGVLRPSFPFSSDYYQSDAHLYSSFLAMGLVMYNFYWRKLFKHKFGLLLLVNIISIPAIVLTGSRTGIAIVVFSQVFSSVIQFRNLLYLKKRTFFIAVIFVGIGIYLISTVSFDKNILRLVERAFTIDSEDPGQGARIRKLLLSVDQTSGTFFLFGVGLLANYITWYDGIVGSTNGYMGLAGLTLTFLIVLKIVRYNYARAIKNKRMDHFIPFIIVFASYLMANLITEYYLVTRGILPTAIFLTILHLQIEKVPEETINTSSSVVS